jgi:hypothetical protein
MLFLNLFILRSKKRQSKFLRCPRTYLLFFEARLLAVPGFGRALAPLAAIKRRLAKGD